MFVHSSIKRKEGRVLLDSLLLSKATLSYQKQLWGVGEFYLRGDLMKQLMRISLCALMLGFSSMVSVQAACLLPCCCAAAKLAWLVAGEWLEESAVEVIYTELQNLADDDPWVLADLQRACSDEKHALRQKSVNVLAPKHHFLNDDHSIRRAVKVLVPVFLQPAEATAVSDSETKRSAKTAEIKVVAFKKGLKNAVATGKIDVKKV